MSQGIPSSVAEPVSDAVGVRIEEPIKKAVKRKTSAYNRKYKAAFKKVSGKYKLKNGNWKSNGFRSAVRAAHKMAGGKR